MNLSLYSKAGLITVALAISGLLLPLSGSAAEGDYSTGAMVWSENCGRCHNIRDPLDLRDDGWKTAIFHMRLRAGLTGQESRDVLAFLVASNNPPRKSIFAAKASSGSGKLDGQAIYNKTCIACHGGNGKGLLPGVPDFTDPKGRLSQSDDVLIKHISEGFQTPGSPMAMPANGGNADLLAGDIKTVLTYMRKQFSK